MFGPVAMTASPAGCAMVPSIRNADKLSARELDAEIRRLTAVVRETLTCTPANLQLCNTCSCAKINA
ncbi:MAG TPA: hypothetical protein DCR15_08625 [Arthrobacter bacterium]|nr:hypothetical protein [Arthrobacter sp.]